jgi:hypothetical protein
MLAGISNTSSKGRNLFCACRNQQDLKQGKKSVVIFAGINNTSSE